ncbi:histidine phosphatase family protein [Legionella saoudiensis]|uniref:histidine phosphatase family protein n=1 Tax=Legionella saoudiensis TaxID=1750561 RepID=UPI000AEA8359|nr:histidine phosphatase family protein [Legionella saoudiensis]
MMSTRLLIARHGNTFAPGEIVRRVGTTDLPLVESGLLQGYALGAYLKQERLIPDVIFTSTLQRTIQTAEQAQKAMGTQLPMENLSIFNELDYGPDENQPEENVVARLGKEALAAWEAQALVPSGWQVSPAEIITNWQHFAEHLRQQYQGKTCLVITSNGIARFAPYLTGDFAAFSAQYPIKIATGALCIFTNELRSSVWNCLGWNVKPPR